MPTVIVYGPRVEDYYEWPYEKGQLIAHAFGCEGIVSAWNRYKDMLTLGYLHLTTEPYRPRSPFIAADAKTGRPQEPIDVYTLAEAEMLTALHPGGYMERALAELTREQLAMFAAFSELTDFLHETNVLCGWWTNLETGEDMHGKRNVPELLALIHSEVSEALEGHRKGSQDDKLPHRPMFRVELIDAVYRICDALGSQTEPNRDHPAGAVLLEKYLYNLTRADHKIENRKLDNGKKY
jgi:hypothetical protein